MRVINHKMSEILPHFAAGKIIKGFGRGSKELGVPTANFSMDVIKLLPADIGTGVYFGWANVDNGDVHKMVMSIGWNPFYNNTEKSMETHILHEYKRDLYGCLLKVCVVGYIRPQTDFKSLESLIEAINTDMKTADTLLEEEKYLRYKSNDYFHNETNL